MKPVLAFTLILTGLLWATVSQAQPQPPYHVLLPMLITQGPPTTPEPNPSGHVAVRDVRTFTSSFSDIRYVVGEVFNGTADPVYTLQVEIRLLDADGQVLASDRVAPVISRLASNGRAGFFWSSPTSPNGVARAEASVVRWETSGDLDYRPLVVTSQVQPVDGGFQVVGHVQNDQTVSLQGVKVVVTFYAADGKVLDVTADFPSSTLQPGATLNYTVSTYHIPAYSTLAVAAEAYTVP